MVERSEMRKLQAIHVQRHAEVSGLKAQHARILRRASAPAVSPPHEGVVLDFRGAGNICGITICRNDGCRGGRQENANDKDKTHCCIVGWRKREAGVSESNHIIAPLLNKLNAPPVEAAGCFGKAYNRVAWNNVQFAAPRTTS